jgi:hypothetical protein
MSVSPFSRYRNLSILEVSHSTRGHTRSLPIRRSPIPATAPGSLQHQLTGYETADLLALKYFGREDLYWHLLDANSGRRPDDEYDLCIMSVATIDGVVGKGRLLIIVAFVGTDLHIRIFDSRGEKVIDKTEKELLSGYVLVETKNRLTSTPNEASLSKEEKQRIIKDVIFIAGHTPDEKLPDELKTGEMLTIPSLTQATRIERPGR